MSYVDGSTYGWHGTINAFLQTSEHDWLHSLQNHHLVCMNEQANASQVKAWENCFNVLQKQLNTLVHLHKDAADWNIIFEYELPRERGWRIDVVILAHTTILVLEFKDFSTIQRAHIDQSSAYARDLQHYHAYSHNYHVYPLLVLTRSNTSTVKDEDVYVTSPTNLPNLLQSLVSTENKGYIDLHKWLAADYTPLPSLISAARTIFRHEPLPHIRRAQSAGIPETIEKLVQISRQAQTSNEHRLARY